MSVSSVGGHSEGEKDDALSLELDVVPVVDVQWRLDADPADLGERDVEQVGEVLQARVGPVELAQLEVVAPFGERVRLREGTRSECALERRESFGEQPAHVVLLREKDEEEVSVSLGSVTAATRGAHLAQRAGPQAVLGEHLRVGATVSALVLRVEARPPGCVRPHLVLERHVPAESVWSARALERGCRRAGQTHARPLTIFSRSESASKAASSSGDAGSKEAFSVGADMGRAGARVVEREQRGRGAACPRGGAGELQTPGRPPSDRPLRPRADRRILLAR